MPSLASGPGMLPGRTLMGVARAQGGHGHGRDHGGQQCEQEGTARLGCKGWREWAKSQATGLSWCPKPMSLSVPPGSLPPGSLSCPVTVTRHPPSHSPPPWEFVSPPSGPVSQHRPFHQPPDPYPTHDPQVPTTALSQPIVCPSWGLVQSHLANN